MPSVDEDAWSTGEAEDSCLGPLPSPQDGAIPCRREPSVEALDRVAGDRSRQLRVANGIIGEIDVLRVLHEEVSPLRPAQRVAESDSDVVYVGPPPGD